LSETVDELLFLTVAGFACALNTYVHISASVDTHVYSLLDAITELFGLGSNRPG
jgi:hypothetical protein